MSSNTEFIWTDLAASEFSRSGMNIEEFKRLWHQCIYCKAWTYQSDSYCYAKPRPIPDTPEADKPFEWTDELVALACEYTMKDTAGILTPFGVRKNISDFKASKQSQQQTPKEEKLYTQSDLDKAIEDAEIKA